VLRFFESVHELRRLLAESKQRPLTSDEAEKLAALLEMPQPWLEWAGKREQPTFDVESVALHIHERVSAQAILRAIRREDIQRDLFADTEQSPRDARAYYLHDIDWANRLITGDSLQVMTSLARRENLAGQVQMIYMDPPYGIKFSSNWQNEVGKRDVKDKDEDLCREPEMIRAYRDTWTLGVHSYLAYLKQRLILARELLKDSGSIFVQIGEENVHRIRTVVDEVFGAENQIACIAYRTSVGLGSEILDPVCNYVVWTAKNKEQIHAQKLYTILTLGEDGATRYSKAESKTNGSIKILSKEEEDNPSLIDKDLRPFTDQGLTSRSGSATTGFPVSFQGQEYIPTVGGWRTGREGMQRVLGSERILKAGETIRFKKCFDDFGALALTNFWDDVGGGVSSRNDPKVYVVQTSTKIIERCMLMTTSPGDLVLDPTCGSGTTAFVAEQWGRRWITIDTSRVAIAIARQRLLTACFDTYKTRNPAVGADPNAPQNPADGFYYKTVPHITLKSIAQNKGLDPIFAKHEPILAGKLAALNAFFSHEDTKARRELRKMLVGKLLKKAGEEKWSSLTESDFRCWLLPRTETGFLQTLRSVLSDKQISTLRVFVSSRETSWQPWQVPFDSDPDWPSELKDALADYRSAWRAKMDEVNAAIAANAEQEELVDQPEVLRGVVRVSGPFTVESVRPPENSLKGGGDEDTETPISGASEQLPETFEQKHSETLNASSHIVRMLELLRHDGLTFAGNNYRKFSQLDAVEGGFIHAEGEIENRRYAVVIGPEFGSVTSFQVENALRDAFRHAYDDLVFAGFSFDAQAQETIMAENERKGAQLKIHMVQIRPDVTMKDLLKKTNKVEQIFTVFGHPRTRIISAGDAGEIAVRMEGVDLYDPVENNIMATGVDKVAAWFVDTDYDGRVFCICQAFFPDKTAWGKLVRALKTSAPEDAFAQLSGTESLPFLPGSHRTVAVKVIDPRGNEVMRVHRLDDGYGN
jgi:adenine-specific DNA-methyltransferase